jgi:hypothetical protein
VPGSAFAFHPPESDRAFALLGELREKEAAWLDVRERFARWLREGGTAETVVRRQLAAVGVKFQPWLYGPEEP